MRIAHDISDLRQIAQFLWRPLRVTTRNNDLNGGIPGGDAPNHLTNLPVGFIRLGDI